MTLPELEEGDTSEKVLLKSHTMLTISRGCRSASHLLWMLVLLGPC